MTLCVTLLHEHYMMLLAGTNMYVIADKTVIEPQTASSSESNVLVAHHVPLSLPVVLICEQTMFEV